MPDVSLTVGMTAAQFKSEGQSIINTLRQMGIEVHRVQEAQQQGGSATRAAGVNLDLFHSKLSEGLNLLRQFAVQTASVAAGMLGLRVAADAAGWFRTLAQEMLSVNMTAERMKGMWEYQFGGPGAGTTISKQISGYLPNFALDTPFNLMEIMQGIGPLSQMGLSFQGIQRFAPMIADIASTHTSIFGGGGPLPFNYAALAIMEAAVTGNARRMFMELQMSPRELEPYGVKFQDEGGHLGGQIENPEMFLPALESLVKDRGWTGASKKLATNTWWGLTSNVQDWWSKFMLRLGGTQVPSVHATAEEYANANEIRPGSIFGTMEGGLKGLLEFVDKHESQFFRFFDKLSDLGGGGLRLLGSALTGFAQGLTQSGLGEALDDKLNRAISWITDPERLKEIEQFATAIGKSLGGSLRIVGDQLVIDVQGFKDLWKSLGPGGQGATGWLLDKLGIGAAHAVGQVGRLVEIPAADIRLLIDLITVWNAKSPGDYFATLGKDILKVLESSLNFITGGFFDKQLKGFFEEQVPAFFEAVGAKVGEWWKPVGDWFGGIFDWIGQRIKEFNDWLNSTFGAKGSPFAGLGTAAKLAGDDLAILSRATRAIADDFTILARAMARVTSLFASFHWPWEAAPSGGSAVRSAGEVTSRPSGPVGEAGGPDQAATAGLTNRALGIAVQDGIRSFDEQLVTARYSPGGFAFGASAGW